MSQNQEHFEVNAYVMLQGRGHIAGRVIMQEIAPGITMVRVDVPDGQHSKSHTRLYAPKAIYGMTVIPSWEEIISIADKIAIGDQIDHPLITH